jgi:aspartate aminotransferase-like enzyme
VITYDIPLVPGPTRAPESVRCACLSTRNQIAIMTGEGMIALWGALKSCIRPGERVLAVSCETPSGTLNPVGLVGGLARQYDVPLFYVDAVASAAGAPVLTDEWYIDLCGSTGWVWLVHWGHIDGESE